VQNRCRRDFRCNAEANIASGDFVVRIVAHGSAPISRRIKKCGVSSI
jgi:regulator of extracellular matrix RemA (YlzA/DUF370 family)